MTSTQNLTLKIAIIIIVSVRNRKAVRRGRQNACVTNVTEAITSEFCRDRLRVNSLTIILLWSYTKRSV